MSKSIVVMPDCDPVVLNALRERDLYARLEDAYAFRVHMGVPSDPTAWLEIVGDAQAILLGANLDDGVLRNAPELKFISFTGLGAANFVDLGLAGERGIKVANTPGYGDASVSEHALALLLAAARRIPEGDRVVRGHEWLLEPGVQLSGKVAGIIGYGGIGAATAKLLAAIGMEVLVWTRTPRESAPEGIRFCSLEEILETADVLSLHLALNDQTQNFLKADHLAKLKKGAILINTARAELIEPGALEARLQDGALFAGLDVFSPEPLVEDSVLRSLPNVVLSPHQGYNTPEALQNLLKIAVDNIDAFFAGDPFFEV